MNAKAKSSFIFNLIDEFEIISKSGSPTQWTDDDLELFCSKYIEQSKERDIFLYNYAASTVNLFRCHIPFTKWTIAVASEVIWYYDELIITDPVIDALNRPIPDLEQQKTRIKNILQTFIEFKEAILGGYILLAGTEIMPSNTGLFDSESNALINNPNIEDWFHRYTQMGQKKSPLGDDMDSGLIQIRTRYGGGWEEVESFGTYIPEHLLKSNQLKEVWYDLISPYTRVTKEELITYGKQDILDGLKNLYKKDINITLEAIRNAQRLNSPVLFFRDLDIEVAKQYALEHPNTNKSILNTSVYDSSLPFVNGILPSRLFDVRNDIPQSFIEFRSFLSQLVAKTIKATDDPKEIRYLIDTEMKSVQSKLVTEMEAINRKMIIHGIVAPSIAMVSAGTMSLISSGINYADLLSTFFGATGLIKSITTLSDVKSDTNKAAQNPAYFLWRVQQTNN